MNGYKLSRTLDLDSDDDDKKISQRGYELFKTLGFDTLPACYSGIEQVWVPQKDPRVQRDLFFFYGPHSVYGCFSGDWKRTQEGE